MHLAKILTSMWERMVGTGPERERNMNAYVRDTPSSGSGNLKKSAR